MLITILKTAALLNGVDPDLLVSICMVETNLKNVVNHSDGGSPSIGMCQIKLATAKLFNPNITEKQLLKPAINADIAAKYLKKQLNRYVGDVRCAVAAYNAGKCNKNTHGIIRNNKYVNKVRQVCLRTWGYECLSVL